MAAKNLISFWEYIQKYIITIPIIQRDYAQGRTGNEYLRQKFLGSLKQALDNPGQQLILDFVYGGLKDDSVYPLDGQQRLTTLWLLHWFVAYKSGVLASVADKLKKFHYRTRISSDEFIQHLCELKESDERDAKDLRRFIKNQRWYRTTWDSDPTISAMLTMIQGTPIRDRDGNDIIDGLVELFASCSRPNYMQYWEALTEKAPIAFYEYALGDEDLPETDALYVKMNARGKPLSDFENFKADLLNYLKRNSGCSDEDVNAIGAWFDNGGVDLFWELSNKESNHYVVDEVFFAFLQRYFLKKLIDQSQNSISVESLESKKSFKFLFGNNGSQKDIQYRDFSAFEDLGNGVLSKDTFDKLKKLSLQLRQQDRINDLCESSWSDQRTAYIIPQYVEKGFSDITVTGRLVFSSVIDYFENNADDFNANDFNDWIRFVWNIIEGTDTSGATELIKVSRFLHGFAPYSGSILKYLAAVTPDGDKNSDLVRQYAEEIVKAKRIVELRSKKDNEAEDMIKQAEKACFYKGSIRFLFTSADGSISWSEFQRKYENSLVLFDSKGVAKKYREDSLLLCYFISQQTKWSQINNLVFSNEASNWRKILRQERYRSSVDKILMHPDIVLKVPQSYSSLFEDPYLDKGFESLQRSVQIDLCNSELMENIVETMDSSGFLHWRYDHYCVYPPNARADWKKYIIADNRNTILYRLACDKVIKFDTERRIGNSGFLWGWDIVFDFNGKTYCWDAWGYLKNYTDNVSRGKVSVTDADSFIKFLES